MSIPETGFQNFVLVNGLKVFIPPYFPIEDRDSYSIAKTYALGYQGRLDRFDANKRAAAKQHHSVDVFSSLRKQDPASFEQVVVDRRGPIESSFGARLPLSTPFIIYSRTGDTLSQDWLGNFRITKRAA